MSSDRITHLELRLVGNFHTILRMALTNSRRYLIWIGSEQAKTFGPTISGLIRRNIGRERITIWDSKYQGSYYFLSSTMVGLSMCRRRWTSRYNEYREGYLCIVGS